METRYQVDANGGVYTIVDAAKTVFWAVITGAASDQIFGKLNAPGFAVEPAGPNLGGKAFPDGTYAITAYLAQSFPHLATVAYPVNYVLSAPGFRDFSISVTIPAGAALPFAGTSAAMRRLPVRLQGRVVDHVTRAPIAGATVISIDSPTPPSVHTTALRSALYSAHASGAAVQQVSITTTASTSLIKDVVGGDIVINLTTRSGLSSGSVVRLKDPAGIRTEYGVVDHLGPGASSSAGEVFLRNALSKSYAHATTSVDFANAVGTGPAGTLSAAADGGDGVLSASLLFAGTVGIELGAAIEEIHEIGAITDTDGFYGFDGIGGVRDIFLQASQGALQQKTDWFVEYDQSINLVNFQL